MYGKRSAGLVNSWLVISTLHPPRAESGPSLRESHKTSSSRLEQTLFAPESLGRLTCAIVGTGALGSEIARLLGQLGLGRVLLIDPDTIAPANLSHSIFFRGSAGLGEPKVAAIARSALRLFPETLWSALQQEIADVSLATLAATDLVFSCPDTPVARTEAAHSVRRLGRPSVDAALLGESWWRGRVAFFPAALDAACYLCQFSEQTRFTLLAGTASSTPGCSTRPATPGLASTPVMASSIAALAVDVGLRHLLERDTAAAQEAFALELTLIGASSHMKTHQLSRSTTCPWHDPSLRSSLREITGPADTVAAMLEQHQASSLVLEWPLVRRARCLHCGYESAPLLRVARFRAHALCDRCGAPNLLPIDTISEVHRNSKEAAMTLADFGLSSPCLVSVH